MEKSRRAIRYERREGARGGAATRCTKCQEVASSGTVSAEEGGGSCGTTRRNSAAKTSISIGASGSLAREKLFWGKYFADSRELQKSAVQPLSSSQQPASSAQ